jgi:hypothetical protein
LGAADLAAGGIENAAETVAKAGSQRRTAGIYDPSRDANFPRAFRCADEQLSYEDNFRVADDTPGMWKVIGHFYVKCDYSVRMGIKKGRVLPGYAADAVRQGASR